MGFLYVAIFAFFWGLYGLVWFISWAIEDVKKRTKK